MKILKNITTLFLSLLICYTSSGANLTVHFCGDEFSKIAFSKHDANCGMMQETDCLAHSNNQHLTKADTCCQDRLLNCKSAQTIIEKDESGVVNKITFKNQLVPYILSGLFLVDLTTVKNKNLNQEHLLKPYKRKVFLLNQSFRI